MAPCDVQDDEYVKREILHWREMGRFRDIL